MTSTCVTYSAIDCIKNGKKLTKKLESTCVGSECTETECCDAPVGTCIMNGGVNDGSHEPNWPKEYCWALGKEFDETQEGERPSSGSSCCKEYTGTCGNWDSNQCTGITRNGYVYSQVKVPDPRDGYDTRTENPHRKFGGNIPNDCMDSSGDPKLCTNYNTFCDGDMECEEWDRDWVSRDKRLRTPLTDDNYGQCCYDLDQTLPENKLVCNGKLAVGDIFPNDTESGDKYYLDRLVTLNDFVDKYDYYAADPSDRRGWLPDGENNPTAPPSRPDLTDPESILCINCSSGSDALGESGKSCETITSPDAPTSAGEERLNPDAIDSSGNCTLPPQKAIPRSSNIIKDMGMDADCEKEAETETGTFAASTSAKSMFGSIGSQISATTLHNKMKQKGCGAFSANIVNIVNSQLSKTCTTNIVKSNIVLSANSTANVTIRTLQPSGKVLDSLTNSRAASDARLTSYIGLATIMTGSENREFLETQIKNEMEIIEGLNETMSPSIRLDNVKIRVTSDTRITGGIKNTNSVKTSLKNDFVAQTIATAEQSVNQATGVNALNPNTKQLIQQKVNNKNDSITNIVNEAILKSNVGGSSSSGIVIETTGPISISNTTLDANAIVDITLNVLNNQATLLGKEIASTIITDVTSKQTAVQKSAGLEDLAKALGDANANAIGTNKAEYSPYMGLIAGVVGLIFGLIFLYMIYKFATK
jgi:hypothetical protein